MLTGMWNPTGLYFSIALTHFVYVYRSEEGQFPCLHFFRWKIQSSSLKQSGREGWRLLEGYMKNINL